MFGLFFLNCLFTEHIQSLTLVFQCYRLRTQDEHIYMIIFQYTTWKWSGNIYTNIQIINSTYSLYDSMTLEIKPFKVARSSTFLSSSFHKIAPLYIFQCVIVIDQRSLTRVIPMATLIIRSSEDREYDNCTLKWIIQKGRPYDTISKGRLHV